jgi:DNA polymerase eta
MLSAKSFQPSINTFDQAVKWLRIFVADIYARLVEEGVVENKRRPKTMNLHHRQGGKTRSRQLSIPSGKKIDETMLLDLAKTLLGQVIVDGRAWPCANLSLSVGGFEDGVSGTRGIGTFLVRGDEAKSLVALSGHDDSLAHLTEEGRPEKRRKLVDEPTIQQFFDKHEITEDHEEEFGVESDHPTPGGDDSDNAEDEYIDHNKTPHLHQQDITSYFCKECQKTLLETDRAEHEDWHFAKSLQARDMAPAGGSSIIRPESRSSSIRSKRGGLLTSRGRGGKTEKGQSRLAFG